MASQKQQNNKVNIMARCRRWLGLPGNLCLWHLTALPEPDRCSAVLAHLGYDYYAPALPAPPAAPRRGGTRPSQGGLLLPDGGAQGRRLDHRLPEVLREAGGLTSM